ncbi:MAG TPA: phosphodiesterase [Microscillaceae bacterium]|nr:phosphodiesterase [Microscillaceae bacterium]
MDNTLRFAQISDLHLYAQKDFVYHEHNTYQTFVQVIDLLKDEIEDLDFILLTGDMAAKQEKEVYYHIDELITPLGVKWHWLPGNHDSATLMQAVAPKLGVQTTRVFEAKGWRFILLNSVDPEEQAVEGILPPEELQFLNQHLRDAPDTSTIVALHHQPIALPGAWVDPLGLQNKEEFYAIVDQHPQIKAVIFGHIHHAKLWERNQIQYLAAPATSYQFNPYTPEFSLDLLAPGYRLYTLETNTIYSEVKRVSLKN